MRPTTGLRSCAVIVVVAAGMNLLPMGSAMAGGDGLVAPANALSSSRWQSRLEVDKPSSLLRGLTTHWAFGAQVSTARLLSDYALDPLRLGSHGQTGGLHLTSGLLVTLRNNLNLWGPASANDAAFAQPYAGIGYSGIGQRGDWGFNADLGLSAQNPGAALQLGRMFNGASLGDTVRDLRLQPMIRLGMNYSF